jgi:hypothetical protein
MTSRTTRHIALVAIALAATSCLALSRANAALTLTPQATAAGYGLSLFVSGFSTEANEANGPVGPLGIVFPNDGVLVSDASGNVRFFANDTDGQIVASAPSLQNYGFNGALGLAQINNNVYMTSQTTGLLLQIDPSAGTTIKTVASIPNATGIAVNPINNHLFVSTYQVNTIYDVNPAMGTATPFLAAFLDGLSTDGTTLYGAAPGSSHVLGFNIASGQQVFDSGVIAGIPDGTALGQGALSGILFANTNGGTVVAINLQTDVQTVLADSGSRGDFVAVDPNGTLLLTQTDSIYRLTAPSGSNFGVPPPTTSVPLPSAAWQSLSFVGMFGLVYGAHKARTRRVAH